MTTKEAINFIEFQLHCLRKLNITGRENIIAMLQQSLAALQDQEERENPKPLTLEELLLIDEEPVYIWFIDAPGRWVIRNALTWVDTCCPERMTMFNMKWYKHATYGVDWIAYRNRPKELKNHVQSH